MTNSNLLASKKNVSKVSEAKKITYKIPTDLIQVKTKL